MLRILLFIWEPIEEALFPNAPKLKHRRRLRQIERRLRKAGVLHGLESLIAGKWAKSISGLADELVFFQPLYRKTLGSPERDYRQMLTRRFWEESFGAEFQSIRAGLVPDALKKRYLENGLDAAEKEKTLSEARVLIEWVRRSDAIVPTREWNALRFFSDLALFPFASILHPWVVSAGGSGDFRKNHPGQSLRVALEDLYHIRGALSPGKDLEQAVVRFWSGFSQDEAVIADLFLHLKRAVSLLFGPCSPETLRDLIRVLKADPDYQPSIAKGDPHWYDHQASEFENRLFQDIEKAWGEALSAWIEAETRALLGGTDAIQVAGYGESESLMLKKAELPIFAYARPITILRTYHSSVVKQKLLPLFKQILIRAAFTDREFNNKLTYWVFRMEELERAFTALEYRLNDGSAESWFGIRAQMEQKEATKSAAGIKRAVEIVNAQVFAFLSEWSQDLVNFLEMGIILRKDRSESRREFIQNWKDISCQDAEGGDVLERGLAGGQAFFAIMRFYVPVLSALLSSPAR